MKFTLAQIKSALAEQGIKLFSRGDYNLNLIGIRNRDHSANTFNDVLCVIFKIAGVEQIWQFACTTDPGTYYRLNPLNVNGTAMLVPGHYKGVWKLGKHQGRYPALVQVKPVDVYRDGDKNEFLDITDWEKDSGYFGINCHRASEKGIANKVDRFSAGCQVIQDQDEYAMLINLCRIASAKHGNSFSYTLLEQNKIKARKTSSKKDA